MLSICFATIVLAAAQPSEDYFTAARAAYVRPEYAACTNTVITRWTTSTLDRADRPVPGGSIGWVAVEGMRNVRDIGGWNGLRTGRAYRGTEPDGHRKDGVLLHGLEITSNGLETIRSVMRIKTDLDLRGAGECPHPDVSSLGVALVRAPVRAYDGLDATKGEWAAALRLFADARHYPIYFHCWGGADRTGQLAFLLEGLCGVSECDLCIDYELTTFGGYPRLRSRGFVDLLNRIKSRPGAALKDRFADFVERELGLTKREIVAIRRNLTEDASVSSSGRKVMIFVAPDGDDAAKGTFEEPVRTLARAVEIAAEPLRREFARTIYLRGGEYPVAETVKLGPEMSGTIVRAYGDERPVLTGAMRVRGFGPVTDAAMKARFPEAVREKVREADVKAQGYRGFEPHAPSGLFYSSAIRKTEPVRRANTLYCGGRRLTPARSPNEGFARIDEVLNATGHVFRASVPEMAKLGRADAPDLVTCGYYQYFWDDENVSAEVTDPSRGVVKIDWLEGREVKKDQTLFFQNAPALLDRPGEWYLDRATGKLYALPPEDADGEYVLAGFAGSFLSLDGCRDVSVTGLVFEYGRGDAVVIRNAERVAFAGNVVRNFGGIGLQATGRDLRIAGNVLHGFGFDAMRVTGGDRGTLEPSGIVIEGNDVSDSGFVQRCYTPGILLNGCGTQIVRNRFHDIPSSAMRVEGNDYDIVSNLIERVVTESDDQGGSDSYGNASYAGTVYRYNVWTDIVPEGVAPCGRAGIRFDDAISNQKVYGNRFHNCSVGHFGGVQIHGGRCNLVSNNLFTACKYGVSVTPWTMERWHAQLDEYRVKRGVRLDSPAYVRRYPGIKRLYDMPMTNTVCCNVMVGVEKDVYSWKLPAETEIWGNGVFKAMPDAEGLKAVAGFEMPPTAEEVGPCPDEPNLKRAHRNDAAVAIPCQAEVESSAKTEVLAEFAKSDEHPRNSEGDVIRLRDGRLLVVYSHFYKDASSKFADGGSDDSSAELVLTESADGGKTWSKMRTAVRKDKGALNVMSSSFLRLDDGRLALFYLNKVSSADCRPVMVVSSDEGKTWSAPVACVGEREKGYYVLNNARAVRLQSGRIALPLAYHPFDGKRHAEGAFLLCALSDDDGRTWRLSSDRRRGTPPPGAKKLSLQEPGLVELRDGRLMMYARSNERRQWRLFSTDGGEHWTEPEPVTEYATTTFSPVTYARLADGRLVVVFNDGAAHADAAPAGLERRWPLAVGVSSDEGKTWKTKVLEPDDAKGTVHACYTAVREIDGRLVLVYCHRDMLATTRVVAVPLDWLP